MDVFIREGSGIDPFDAYSEIGRETNLLTLVQRLIMKALISRRQVVASLSVHGPTDPVIRCKRAPSGSWEAARREAKGSNSMFGRGPESR